MWWIGLTMCLMGFLGVMQDQKRFSACFWFAFVLVGLVSMWVGK